MGKSSSVSYKFRKLVFHVKLSSEPQRDFFLIDPIVSNQ